MTGDLYTHDAVGNRTQKTSTIPGYPGGLSTYNANDQLTTDTVVNTERAFERWEERRAALRAGCGKGHVTPELVLQSAQGCCIGTIEESAT